MLCDSARGLTVALVATHGVMAVLQASESHGVRHAVLTLWPRWARYPVSGAVYPKLWCSLPPASSGHLCMHVGCIHARHDVVRPAARWECTASPLHAAVAVLQVSGAYARAGTPSGHMSAVGSSSLGLSMGSRLFASATSGMLSSVLSTPSALPSAVSALPSARLTARTSVTDVGGSNPGDTEAPVVIVLAEDVRLEVPRAQRAPPLPATLSTANVAPGFLSAKPCESITAAAAGRLASLSVAVGSCTDDALVGVDANASGLHVALSDEQVQALVCMTHMHSSKLRSSRPDAPAPARMASCRLAGTAAGRGVAIDSSNFDGAETDEDEDAAAGAAAEGEGLAAAIFRTANAAYAGMTQVLHAVLYLLVSAHSMRVGRSVSTSNLPVSLDAPLRQSHVSLQNWRQHIRDLSHPKPLTSGTAQHSTA